MVGLNAIGSANDEDASCVPESRSDTSARESAQGGAGAQPGITGEGGGFGGCHGAVVAIELDELERLRFMFLLCQDCIERRLIYIEKWRTNPLLWESVPER